MDKQLIELCLSNWKSHELILEIMNMLPSEQLKSISSRFAFEQRQFQRFLQSNQINLVSYTNQAYSVNLPVTVINSHEMEQSNQYMIIKTLEPSIVVNECVIHWGRILVAPR